LTGLTGFIECIKIRKPNVIPAILCVNSGFLIPCFFRIKKTSPFGLFDRAYLTTKPAGKQGVIFRGGNGMKVATFFLNHDPAFLNGIGRANINPGDENLWVRPETGPQAPRPLNPHLFVQPVF